MNKRKRRNGGCREYKRKEKVKEQVIIKNSEEERGERK
jgi:hypothetical protein